VQLTWQTNYEKAGKLTGEDLVQFPDKALEPPIAAKILVLGMNEGLFTGVGLPRYINATKCDFYNARRCVNGLDNAKDIAEYANSFLQALAA
jgi:predicted chitinase